MDLKNGGLIPAVSMQLIAEMCDYSGWQFIAMGP